MRCVGTEESILDCPSINGSEVTCTHENEAGVNCSESKECEYNIKFLAYKQTDNQTILLYKLKKGKKIKTVDIQEGTELLIHFLKVVIYIYI